MFGKQQENIRHQHLHVGWLIDGRGGACQRDMVIGIKDGIIIDVKPFRGNHTGLYDLSHATVLPALMDAHVHLVFSGTTDARRRKAQLNDSLEDLESVIFDHLQRHRLYGVVAVRDGGDRHGLVLQCKRGQRFGSDSPYVAATCWAWHAKGRYGGMLGNAPPENLSLSDAIKDHLHNVDHIKVIQSGLNSIDRYGHQGPPQFSQEMLSRTVMIAHAAQRPVMVHANGKEAVQIALDAGCDSIEHGYFMGLDNLKRMADLGTCWVPTAVPMAELAKAPSLSDSQREVARRTLDHQLEQIHQARAFGVTIALGTDAGSFGVDHGAAVGTELGLFIKAGFSIEQAIACASANVAPLMGFSDRGSLVPGKRADFIIVPCAADQVLNNLNRIASVVYQESTFKLDGGARYEI